MTEADHGAALDQFSVTLPDWPYPGLRPFDKHEWPIFFGRERMSDEVVNRLVREQFLVVHGDSGCGKSSLIRAGVLPRLEQENARGGLTWRTCATQPRNAPLQLLAEALAGLDGRGGDETRVTELRRVLNFGAEAPRALAGMLRRGSTDHICILIDQFEELFAFARRQGSADARLFVQILVALLEQPPQGLYAVVTMRSEFLGACAHFPGLAEAVNRAQYLLPRMSHGDLTRAIREPASLYGGQIAPELAERLIVHSGGSQDQLPLIQHGLMLLYLRKRKEVQVDAVNWQIGLDDYGQIRDLTESLSQHADDVLQSVEADPFPLAEKVFRALTEINADGQAVRRPRTVAQLAAVSGADTAAVIRLVDVFRAEGASFLTPFGAGAISPDTLVDISHEALIRCWNRIANAKTGWLAREFQDGLIWRSLLVQAEGFERSPSHLLSLSTAEEHERWLAAHNPIWAERYGGGWDRVQRLMQASLTAGRAVEHEERERARRKQRTLVAFGAFLALVAIALFWLDTRTNNALARANEASASSLWNRLDFTDSDRLQSDELNALWEVRRSDNAVRSAFFEQLARVRDRVVRLGRRPRPVLRAIYLQWAADKAAAARDSVLREAAASADLTALGSLAPAVQATAESMTSAQAQDLFERYLRAIHEHENKAALSRLLLSEALPALAARLDQGAAGSVLTATLTEIRGLSDADVDAERMLGTAAGATVARIGADQVEPALSSVLALPANGGLDRVVARLPILTALADRVPADQVAPRLSRLLADLDHATENDWVVRVSLIGALAKRAAAADARNAVRSLVAKAMSPSNDARIADIVELNTLLVDRMPPEDARGTAIALVRDIAATTDPRRIAKLVMLIRPFLARLTPDDQRLVVNQAARSLATATNILEINVLVSLLGAHGDVLADEEAGRAVLALIATARYEVEAPPPEPFAAAAAKLGTRLAPAEADAQIRNVFKRIQSSVAPSELAALAAMLPGLAAQLSQTDAGRLLPELWQWMTATTDVGQLKALSYAVPALAVRLTEENGRRSLPGCMRYLMGTTDPDQIGALAVAARTLADLIPSDQRAPSLTPLHAALEGETDPDRLARVSPVIPPLAPGLTAAQADDLFRKITRAMENTLYADQLASLRAAAEAVALKVSAGAVPGLLSTAASALAAAADHDRIDALTAAAQALGTRADPSQGDVLLTLIGWAATPDQAAAAARALLARPAAGAAAAQVAALVEILKYPTATGDTTTLLLDALRRADKNAPGSDAGLDANLSWVAKSYQGIRLADPPACPPPILSTLTCPATAPRSIVEQLESTTR